MRCLILIDGNALLHRAFHALPPLTSRNGELVNAVYGFFSMFLRIIADFRPDNLVVCFDRPKPTFRKQMYIGYQAKRPKMSNELVSQVKIVHDILEAAKICIFEVDGYEADDLIGTLAYQSQNQETIIVSGDRDLLQLIDSHVKVAMPIIGITNMSVFDSAKVEGKYGIKPPQIVDYKALAGDSSDNYSGVPGIGPKTAVFLLKEYGTLESIYKNLDELREKNPGLALKLARGTESAGLAKKLAAIATDAPITLNLTKCSIKNLDKYAVEREFEKLGFKSLIKRVQNQQKVKEEKAERNKQLGLF